MTCPSSLPKGATTAHSLSPLVRLLARDLARSDFAARCTTQTGEDSHD